MDKRIVKQTLFAIEQLPMRPDLLREMMELSRDPNASMTRFTSLIERDPMLTRTVLGSVNSTYYAVQNDVTNLRVAITMLGMRRVNLLIANASYFKAFQKIFPNVDCDHELFWHHCQTTAAAAQYLARKHQKADETEAYLAGLFHDIGKLVMEEMFNAEWQKLRLSLYDSEGAASDVEREIFGMTHGEIGSYLTTHWRLSQNVVAAVQYHHEPHLADRAEDLSTIIYFAENLASRFLSNGERKLLMEEPDQDSIWERMCRIAPHLNLLEDEEQFEAAQNDITRTVRRQQ